MRAMRWGALAAVVTVAAWSPARADDPSLVSRGEYLARAGDCEACHTAPGGAPMAGGLEFKLPIGSIYSSNITPDPKAGIGSYTEAEFADALRRGIRKDGRTLYPAMPFPSYARITDEDIQALYIYFMQGVQPVATPTRDADIHWPLSMRWPLVAWRWMFAPPVGPASVASSVASTDPVLARGAYLVEGLGHCGACHTSRGIALQEKVLSNSGGPGYLAGGSAVEGWIPQSLRGDDLAGLGRWTEDDIVAFLKTGRNRHGSVFGGMSPVVAISTQYMTGDDLHAIARYLKSLSPSSSAVAGAYKPDDTVSKQLFAGDTSSTGSLAYLNNCAACHRTTGAGYPTVFPPLAGNPVVQAGDPQGLIRIVLLGNTVPATQAAPSTFTMPGFAGRLSDTAVADIVTFIRTSWGNQGKPVTAADVAASRKDLPPTLTRTVSATAARTP